MIKIAEQTAVPKNDALIIEFLIMSNFKKNIITIGMAADALEISVSSIREYEALGFILLRRSVSGRRILSEDDVQRIAIIKRLLEQGYSFDRIRRLLAKTPCWDNSSCSIQMRNECPAFSDPSKPCWMITGTICRQLQRDCYDCEVYEQAFEQIEFE